MVYYAEAVYKNILTVKPILKLARKSIAKWLLDENKVLHIYKHNSQELIVHKGDILYILEDKLEVINPSLYDAMIPHLAWFIDKHKGDIKYLIK